ncbi:MAG: anthranilate phosphoribosyltransferase [Aquificae bacterium]|nr:anthranilate phosphoribosyltransferase [Aquificota bacterium]
MRDYIRKVTEFQDLTSKEVKDLFSTIMEGKATDAQIGAILTGLKMKGETEEEISSAASVMREKAVKVPIKNRENLVDTCGTGGDKINTFNVSTITAFVIAGAGAKVAKHGNRSVSSKCGSADLMEALGIKIDMTPSQVAYAIEEIGLGFLFAPIYHPAMKNVVRQRKELGVRTIFNILGPLSNPAGAKYQLLGVYDKNLVEPLTKVLMLLGIERAFVVHGLEGLDEISITGETLIGELNYQDISIYKISPRDFGLKESSLNEIQGGDLEDNKKIAMDILTGKDKSSKTDMVVLNSAFALKIAGVVSSIEEGIEKSKDSIHSGKAYTVLEKLREYSKNL